ncbi:glycoside hydrolase family 25 protein [Mucilaginibacter sp. AK015]|uniref:glycoside hydrolase family 25 protein n=1 Tax=Mucilaginibacter sp. AK015 TaxID=2723072 RepID=UPI0017F7B62D|nr:lysozyme [Mucilaginibacter sp. AK015]
MPVKKKNVRRKKKAKTPSRLKYYLALAAVLLLLSPFYYGYVIKTASYTWRWIKDIGKNTDYRTYKSFGIRIPSNYQVHGIDVSYAQGKINWTKVAEMEEDGVRIRFAFIKATEGLVIADPYFKRNWKEARKAGIACGAYHFFRPRKSGLWQARFFVQNASLQKGGLPPVADVERLDGKAPAAMRKELKEFLRFVANKTGETPIIYTGISFYRDYLAGYFDEYPLWIAHYNRDRLNVSADTNWMFWQHAETGRVNGIGHKVDFDVFKGDSLAFERFIAKSK